jgi:RNA polymerase sigma-70 factor, ECF subfamily
MSFPDSSRFQGLESASDSAPLRQSGAEQNLPALVEDLLPASIGTTALNEALPGIYDELRALAAGYLRGERPDHTLQPTALVHESYLRLVKQHSVDWGNRLQFLSIAARMMRRILSNHASARATNKRGSGESCLELDAALEFYERKTLSIAAVDEALRDLEAMDPRQAQVVELRFFGGLTIEETAKVMNLSLATVKRDWVTARHWLQREMSAKG